MNTQELMIWLEVQYLEGKVNWLREQVTRAFPEKHGSVPTKNGALLSASDNNLTKLG